MRLALKGSDTDYVNILCPLNIFLPNVIYIRHNVFVYHYEFSFVYVFSEQSYKASLIISIGRSKPTFLEIHLFAELFYRMVSVNWLSFNDNNWQIQFLVCH